MNLSITSALALRRNVSLAEHTTLQVGGPAAYLAEPRNEEHLSKLLLWAQQEGLSYYVLGNGSNVIFDDAGYEGLVLSMRKFQNDLMKVDLDSSRVTVSAGTSLSRLVRFCQESGLAGVEFLAQIPGSVGGAVMMNAGFSRHSGQRNEIGDLIDEIRALKDSGLAVHLNRGEMNFGYRESSLGGYILLEVTLRLWRRPKDQIQKELAENSNFRKLTQDIREPSAGSIFKNPGSSWPSAGELIERAGLKGRRIGGIQVSEKHANYFINRGGARSADILALIEEVREAVLHATGITLETEVRIVRKN